MWVLGKGARSRGPAAALAFIMAIAGLAFAGKVVAAVATGAATGGSPEIVSPPATGSDRQVDLSELLTSAGFADAVLMSDEELRQAGEHFAAGWTAPAGDLVGLLFLVPADEPRATVGAFVDQLDRSCAGRFTATPDRIEALDNRAIVRANAACHGDRRSLHYEMVFRFAESGTLGIVHIAFDAAAPRASAINSGLVEILGGW